MTTKDKIAYDEFGRRGVHNERLEEIIELLSKEIVSHCIAQVPPSEGLASLAANINSLTLQVISHLIYKVTRDQYELKQVLKAMADGNVDGNGNINWGNTLL